MARRRARRDDEDKDTGEKTEKKKDGEASGSEPESKRPAATTTDAKIPAIAKKLKGWVVGGIAGSLATLIALVLFRGCGGSGYENLLFAPVDFGGTSVVFCDTLAFSLQKPYYTTVDFLLKEGDLVEVHATGKGGFSRFYRGRYGDTITPEGWERKPNDLNWVLKTETKFLVKNLPMGALCGSVGTIEYDQSRTPKVNGTKPFLVGSEGYVKVPGKTRAPKIHFCMNEEWTKPAWDDNWGVWIVIVTVHRPV